MKTTALLMLFLALIFSLGVVADDQTSSSQTIPAPVWKLLEWPPTELIRQKAVTAAPEKVSLNEAVASAERWLRITIDPLWLPEEWEPLCLEGEFEERDVIRYRWQVKRWDLMIAQTASIFVLEVRPGADKLEGKSPVERLERVREICSEVLAKTGFRWTGKGEKVPIPELNKKILEYSFGAGRTAGLGNKSMPLRGKAINIIEAGVPLNPSPDEVRVLDKSNNPDWMKAAVSWMYWFRNVHWFADDERVVIYFLKTEGGPVALSFGGSLDNIWFGKK